MRYRPPESTISGYKTSPSAFLIITIAAICILWPPSAPPGEWMRRLNTVRDVFNGNIVSSNCSTVADLITAPPEGRTSNKTGRYVSMSQHNFDNRRVGNRLFNFAAMLHVARLTGRRVAMVRHHPHGWLDRWFEVPVTRVDGIDIELCPCVVVGEAEGLAYHKGIPKLPDRTGEVQAASWIPIGSPAFPCC